MRAIPRLLLAALLVLPLAATLHAPPARAIALPEGQRIDETLIGRTDDGRLYARNRVVVRLRAGSASLGAMRPGRAGSFSLGGTALESSMRGLGVSGVERAVSSEIDGSIPRAFGLDERWLALELEPGRDALAAARQLAGQFEVESAEPDWVATLMLVPNDSLYSKNWGHNNSGTVKGLDWSNLFAFGTLNKDSTIATTLGFDVNAEAAWSEPQDYGVGSVVVGIIDSGVDIDHPDLIPNLVQGWDFTSGDNNPDEGTDAHGTACAGITAGVAGNTIGVAGIAGKVKIMPLRAQSSPGFVSYLFAGQAVLYGIANGADILSMSFGGNGYPGDFFKKAVASADSAGLLMFAATGNDNASTIAYPARWPEVIAVGAAAPCASRKRSTKFQWQLNLFTTPPPTVLDSLGTSCENEFYWGSNWGVAVKDDSAAVDIIAPTILPTTDILGAGGYSTAGYYDYFNGTSCATPYAAGVAALVLSRFSNITAAQVRNRLKTTAIDISDVQTPAGWDKYTGYGMVDAYQAVRAPNFIPRKGGAWDDYVVPRTTNDATPSTASLPATLPGDGTTYLNIGIQNAGGWSYVTPTFGISVDGALTSAGNVVPMPPNSAAVMLNVGRTIPGGLHSLESRTDYANTQIESNETDNDYGRQYSWIPSTLAVDTHITRGAPPSQTGGTSNVSGTVYPNMDGMRVGPRVIGWWQGTALRANSGDYDLDLFATTTGTADGFRTPLASSSQGANATDFVIVNFNYVTGTHDVGVLNEGGTGVAHLELRQSPSNVALELGAFLDDVPMAADQMLYVQEYYHVPNVANPRILFDLTTSPAQDLHLALFDEPTTFATRADALYDVTTDENGRAIIDAPLPTAGQDGFYGIAVFRDAADGGTAPLTFDLEIRATPADLANVAPGSWVAPIVPDSGVAFPDPTTNPTGLIGNVNNTRIRYSYRNDGAQTATGFQVRELIDGADILTWTPGNHPAGAGADWITGYRNIRGGRHTLGYILDLANTIDETYEDNNAFANQWVWSPLQLAPNTPVTRSMPPPAEGGWTEIPAAVTRYDNSDGLRSPVISVSGNDGFWGAVAAVPGPGSDIDLDWHGLSSGPTSGFAAPVFTSADGVGRTELLISDHPFSPNLQFDVGVINVSGNAAYTAQSVRSAYQGTNPPLIGPVSIPPGEVVRVFEFERTTPAPLQALLENISGNADLGISMLLFDGVIMPQGMASGIAYEDAGGPGDPEEVLVNSNLSGQFIGVAVYKTQASELGKSATFQIRLDTPTNVDVGDPLPSVLAFAVAGANPVSERAQLRFDLPEAGRVALEVFDVQGHRVKTLADGMFEPGVHHVSWNGSNDGGRRLGSGLYFVRFSSGNFSRVAKVTLVR